MDIVHRYHQRSKHRFEAYAPGPDTLDWDAQPAAFRHYYGCETVSLPAFSIAATDPLIATALKQPFSQINQQNLSGVPLTLNSLSVLLQLSFGITAWKSYGPDRWAVRANPSSGNLHPVEAYLIMHGVCGLPDGVYHYCPDDHTLECRATLKETTTPSLQLALSSAMWRETWKYGERAFRYCQLDIGHAAGALSYAVATLGWTIAEKNELGTSTLAHNLGLDRNEDFPARKDPATEREEAEILFSIHFGEAMAVNDAKLDATTWHGTASQIDPYPMYQWPAVEEIALATRQMPGKQGKTGMPNDGLPGSTQTQNTATAQLILQRRSAQRFDPSHIMGKQQFIALLDALLPRSQAPWNVLANSSHINLLLFIHRVEGFRPGLYLLGRHAKLAQQLHAQIKPEFVRTRINEVPAHIDICLLTPAPGMELQRMARSLHCHQDIASNACFAIGMLAEFDEVLANDPAAYRALYREAGLIGQVLYLQAEASGLRGTGIGCYFDDPVHEILGLKDSKFQSLYHFTVGMPIEDNRIETSTTFNLGAIS